MSADELEESPSEEMPEGPGSSALPLGEMLAGIYRQLWRHRWPYLGQLAIWTILIWLSQFPARIIVFSLSWAGIFLPVGDLNLLPWLVSEAVKLLFLMLGGSVIFLSCGCAFLFGRRPRAGDALQFPKIGKSFWLAIFFFWLAAELAAAVAFRALSVNAQAFHAATSWLGPLGLQGARDAYPILIWALVGLALPIAAFEKAAAPFPEAWRRLIDVRRGVLLLTAIAAVPVLVPQFALSYAWQSMAFAMFDIVPMMGWVFYAFATLMHWADIFLSLLLFLVLSATTLTVYLRLAPDSAELAKTFD